MFKPKDCPAYEKGRWYTFLVESDGSSYTLTTSELEGVTTTDTGLKMPDNFHIIDFIVDINNTTDSLVSYAHGIDQFTDGAVGVVLPLPESIDWTNVYIFGYFTE